MPKTVPLAIGRPAEILLVEDNPGDVRLTQEAFRESKFLNNLHVVSDGESAMSFLQRTDAHEKAPRPDLVLLDLNLPIMSGRELLAEIKKDEGLRDIPVVILSSSDADADILESYRGFAACHVTKPLDVLQFAKVVRSI